jgi:hypothetical protein
MLPQTSVILHEDVGWGPTAVDRLVGLRLVLYPHTAKLMDKLLLTGLKPSPKVWKLWQKSALAPKSEPAAWGPAIEGVQVRLRADKKIWKTGTLPSFKADVRNDGKRDISVLPGQHGFEVEVDGRWYFRYAPGYDVPIKKLRPGAHCLDIVISLGREWLDNAARRSPRHPGGWKLALPPGRHVVRVAPVLADSDVRVVSNPVEIEIAPGRPETGASNEAEDDPAAAATALPEGPQAALDAYSRCVAEREGERDEGAKLRKMLCFVDREDERLFVAFSGKDKIYVRSGIFPSGKPVECKRASDDCWLVVLDGGVLLELWRSDGKWRVLCPTPGFERMARAKLTTAETPRHLRSVEMKRVQEESEAQLERRRARYLAVLELSGRHRLKDLHRYFAGIPTTDPATLAGMSLDEFRKAVLLKLDAPSGLRYRVIPEAKSFGEGEPVWVTFLIENVTAKPIKLNYEPSVEIVDWSSMITARGARVFLKGEDTAQRKNPYRSKAVYPLKEREVNISPGKTHTAKVNLLDYYDLPPARYSISSRLDTPRNDEGSFWHGSAMADTVLFVIGQPSPRGQPSAGRREGDDLNAASTAVRFLAAVVAGDQQAINRYADPKKPIARRAADLRKLLGEGPPRWGTGYFDESHALVWCLCGGKTGPILIRLHRPGSWRVLSVDVVSRDEVDRRVKKFRKAYPDAVERSMRNTITPPVRPVSNAAESEIDGGSERPARMEAVASVLPEGPRAVLDAYFQCLEAFDGVKLRETVCFADRNDEERFANGSSGWHKICAYGADHFPNGKPVAQRTAMEGCWILVLDTGSDGFDTGSLLELWKVDGRWRVLCPTPERLHGARAQFTKGVVLRTRDREEMKQVQKESEAQLERRRARYLAVLGLSEHHRVDDRYRHYHGTPTTDPAALAGMSLDEFRKAVVLKLDAPSGLRYRITPEAKSFGQQETVWVTFLIENVTAKPIKLKYRPLVELAKWSKAATTQRASVFPTDNNARLGLSPFTDAAYPFEEKEVSISPGQTYTTKVDLRKYYVLPSARYTIFARLYARNPRSRGAGGFWQGSAMADTVAFEIGAVSDPVQPEAQPAESEIQAAWSDPVDGLRIRLRPTQKQWKSGTTPTLALDLRNDSHQDKTSLYFGAQALECEIEADGRWYRWAVPVKYVSLSAKSLKAGQAKDEAVRILLTRSWVRTDEAMHGRPVDDALRLNLTPGTHTVRVAFTPTGPPPREKGPRVVSMPVRIAIDPVQTEAQPADQPSAPVAPSAGRREGDDFDAATTARRFLAAVMAGDRQAINSYGEPKLWVAAGPDTLKKLIGTTHSVDESRALPRLLTQYLDESRALLITSQIRDPGGKTGPLLISLHRVGSWRVLAVEFVPHDEVDKRVTKFRNAYPDAIESVPGNGAVLPVRAADKAVPVEYGAAQPARRPEKHPLEDKEFSRLYRKAFGELKAGNWTDASATIENLAEGAEAAVETHPGRIINVLMVGSRLRTLQGDREGLESFLTEFEQKYADKSVSDWVRRAACSERLYCYRWVEDLPEAVRASKRLRELKQERARKEGSDLGREFHLNVMDVKEMGDLYRLTGKTGLACEQYKQALQYLRVHSKSLQSLTVSMRRATSSPNSPDVYEKRILPDIIRKCEAAPDSAVGVLSRKVAWKVEQGDHLLRSARVYGPPWMYQRALRHYREALVSLKASTELVERSPKNDKPQYVELLERLPDLVAECQDGASPSERKKRGHHWLFCLFRGRPGPRRVNWRPNRSPVDRIATRAFGQDSFEGLVVTVLVKQSHATVPPVQPNSLVIADNLFGGSQQPTLPGLEVEGHQMPGLSAKGRVDPVAEHSHFPVQPPAMLIRQAERFEAFCLVGLGIERVSDQPAPVLGPT